MNSIDTRIATVGMATSIRAGENSEYHAGKPPVKDTATKSSPGNTQFYPVQTEASFSTYGSRNERIAVVVKNKDTGEVIREIPSKEMQKLHGHLDVLA
jgi:uncharacterized FlaG/YvyC family protein